MANNEKSSQLIELVKKNPCLYNPKDLSYKDRVKRSEIWQAIAEDLNISSIDAKTDWEQLRRKYITRRSKDLPSDTNFDKMMSFLEGCYGLEKTQNRSAMKPPLPPSSASSSSTGAVMPATSTNNSNHEQPATTSNGGPSTTSDNASSSNSQKDRKRNWLSLLFEELSQKARRFPIGKQLDIAKQVSKIFEEDTDETATTSNGGPSTTSDNISRRTSQEDRKRNWLSLLFEELSQKVRRFPIGKQLDIAKQVSKILETAETGTPDEMDCICIG